MRKILVPFDGSASALRAVCYAVSTAQENRDLELELLYVLDPMAFQPPAALSQLDIEHLQADEAGKVLHPTKVVLKQAGVPYQVRTRVGAPANQIAQHAREMDCDAIIMGTRGMGPITSIMIGSVATRTVHLTEKPVTLIK